MAILVNPFIEILVGGIVAGIALFSSKQLYDYFNRPKLNIEKLESLKSEKSNNQSEFVILKINNTGKTVVKNCVGKITIGNLERSDLKSGINAIIEPRRFTPIKKWGYIGST